MKKCPVGYVGLGLKTSGGFLEVRECEWAVQEDEAELSGWVYPGKYASFCWESTGAVEILRAGL